MAHLITGAKGQAHITPKSDAVWHRGMMGVESCILDFGEKLTPALIPSQPTNIRILDGCGMMQGRFFEIEEGSYDTIAIPNGAQGYNRIDIVCAKITQNENGTQTFSWEVVQGTQTEGTPQPPTVTEGSLDDGDEFALMPIASVELEGVNIVAVETVATISTAGEHLSLDTDATEGVDKELTDTLTSLGWLSNVIDGVRGMLNVKKFFCNILEWISRRNYVDYKDEDRISIASYSSASNLFTVPADGLIRLECNYRGGSYILLNDESSSIVLQGSSGSANSAGNTIICIPVFKGQKFFVTRSNTYSYAYFIPYRVGSTQ